MTISAHENPPRYHENPPRYKVVKRHTDQHKRRLRGPLFVKVFGCRPFAEACRRAETGPAFENLQGRKPRVGRAPIRRTRYGDLKVASVCWRVVAMTIKDDFEG